MVAVWWRSVAVCGGVVGQGCSGDALPATRSPCAPPWASVEWGGRWVGTRLGGAVECQRGGGITDRARLLPRASLHSLPPRPPPRRRAASPPRCARHFRRHGLRRRRLLRLRRRHLLRHQFHPSRHPRRRAAQTVCTAARGLPHCAQRTAARHRRAPAAKARRRGAAAWWRRRWRLARAMLAPCSDCSADRPGCAPLPGSVGAPAMSMHCMAQALRWHHNGNGQRRGRGQGRGRQRQRRRQREKRTSLRDRGRDSSST